MSKTYAFVFLQPGDKVFLSHRRLFPNDKGRFFVGTVVGFNENNGLLKVTGYSISLPLGSNQFVRKGTPNTKIVSLTSGTLIAYELPEKMDVETATLKFHDQGLVMLEDSKGVMLDLTE